MVLQCNEYTYGKVSSIDRGKIYVSGSEMDFLIVCPQTHQLVMCTCQQEMCRCTVISRLLLLFQGLCCGFRVSSPDCPLKLLTLYTVLLPLPWYLHQPCYCALYEVSIPTFPWWDALVGCVYTSKVVITVNIIIILGGARGENYGLLFANFPLILIFIASIRQQSTALLRFI